MSPLKLLIDRNLQFHAQTAELVSRPETLKWGPHIVTNNIQGFRGKALPESEWLRRQLMALPTIARLAREGSLIFCATSEIQSEAMFGSVAMQGSTGDLFRHIDYEYIPPAIDRSYFSQNIDFAEYAMNRPGFTGDSIS